MNECCSIAADIPERQRRILQIVLWVNLGMFLFLGMFLAEFVAGLSLYAVARGAVWQTRAALLKGTIMAVFGIAVLLEVTLKIIRSVIPTAEVMGGVGLVALAANIVCLTLLWRRRTDDINMRSAWLCARNDVTANSAVVLAAGGVALTGSAWPDIVVGLAIAALFGASAVEIIRKARRE